MERRRECQVGAALVLLEVESELLSRRGRVGNTGYDDVIACCKLVLISSPAFAHHPRISSFIARRPNKSHIGPNGVSNG